MKKTAVFLLLLAVLLLSVCGCATVVASPDAQSEENVDLIAIFAALNGPAFRSVPVTASLSYEAVSNQTDLSASTIKKTVRTLISKTTHTETYNELRTDLAITDRGTTSGTIRGFYTHKDLKAAWDGGKTWNREHVWPQSKGWFTTGGAGADIHHIRPEDSHENSSRGNTPFGESSGYYNPPNNAKGDVARIIFYMLTRYQESDSYSIKSVAESFDTLLKWNRNDPVDEYELYRNDQAYLIQGNRNPFIDYPELAEYIWGSAKAA